MESTWTNDLPAALMANVLVSGQIALFSIFSYNCPFQVFVLMQFGRKKDWPHGKLILENNIVNRKNIFYPNVCKSIHPQIKIASFRQRDSRIQG